MLCVAATQSSGYDALGINWKIANEVAAENGRKMDPEKLRLVGPVHIAETRAEAMANVKYGFVKWQTYFQKIIHGAKHPVMTIKPLAAGRLLPPTGLAFVWSTIRDCDLVTIGAFNPYEAEEDIEISLACLEKRRAQVELQTTRSKRDLVAT